MAAIQARIADVLTSASEGPTALLDALVTG